MINKKTLMLIGGGIAAYYIWKNYIKEDETTIAHIEGKSMNGHSPKVDAAEFRTALPLIEEEIRGRCVCRDSGGKIVTCPCSKANALLKKV